MRLYYGPDPVDLDDLNGGPLSTAITSGIVPPGCKLGGSVVLRENAAGRDPCLSVCPHREREGEGGCGGRAMDARGIYAVVNKPTHHGNGQSEARKAFRETQIFWLEDLAKKAPKRKNG